MSNPTPKTIPHRPRITLPKLAPDEEVFENVPQEAPGSPQSTSPRQVEAPVTSGPGRNTISAIVEAPVIQYANGKSMARPAGVAGARFKPLCGFYSEVGKDTDLDDAMASAKIAQIEIKHQRQGGAEIVKHWSLPSTLALYPVTSGPVAPTVAGSLAGRNARATSEAGIGLRWGAGERSKMAIRGYLDVLVKVGYTRLVQLSVRSRMTDVLLGALIAHAAACEAADHLIDRSKHPEVVTYHELALPLGPGEEQEWGKGDTATVVPFVALHPQQIDADYLRTIWRPPAVHTAALGDWESIQRWAAEYATEADEPERGEWEGGK